MPASTVPPRPNVLTTISELRVVLAAFRREEKRIGLVPTMGNLHEGHLSLVRASQTECDVTVVSIYVNPGQFAPHEDFKQYPRTLDADLAMLAPCGETLVFVPADEEIYPPGFDTWVEVGSPARSLEGESRPGHFRGVATVVLKLFNIVAPDAAYFGQKDFQQTAVIRRMTDDLDLPIELRVCPTVREPDGLAMSSRNAYLGPEARQEALVLSKSLGVAAERVAQGRRDAEQIAAQMREVILSAKDAEIDYVALVDPETLEPVAHVDRPTVALVAVRFGSTRLIDNCLLEPNR